MATSNFAADAALVDVVVMAAGKGTRMKSARPKVLHHLAGRALLRHVLDTAIQLSARRAVIIVGHQAEQVQAQVLSWPPQNLTLDFARQEPQLGTGHAVQQALPLLADDGVTLILSGDVPLTQAHTLQALIGACAGQHLALLTLELPDPSGYGRIVRQGQAVQAIVEHKDANDEQRRITEIYSGIMAVPTRQLRSWLARLDNKNAQGEYYLTDVVKFAVADGVPVLAHRITDAAQVAGINSPLQLAELERTFQLRQAQALMEQGTRLADPARFDVLLCENTFGDMLSDEAAALAGSLGMLPSASLGASTGASTTFGLYEPAGGTAPDIAGKGIANPLAQILSATLLLRYSLGLESAATAVEKAIEKVIASGMQTRDVCAPNNPSPVGTRQIGQAIVEAILAGH